MAAGLNASTSAGTDLAPGLELRGGGLPGFGGLENTRTVYTFGQMTTRTGEREESSSIPLRREMICILKINK